MRAAREALDGIRAAFTTFCIYGAFLLSVCALTTLVATVESGGSSLSGSAQLASAAFLMSEGSIVRVDGMRIGVMPLGLTLMLVLMLDAVIRRRGARLWGLLAGMATWSVLHAAMLNLSRADVERGATHAVLLADVCYLAGFALAARPRVRDSSWLRERLDGMLPAPVRALIARGCGLALRVACAYLAVGLVAVIVWTVRYRGTVVQLFELSGMPAGSRVTTSLVSLAWLPNAMLWAVSWVFGPGFHIGKVASYTMWSVTSTGLPPVPAFGIFPDAVASDDHRMLLLCVPMAVAFVISCADMFVAHRNGLMESVASVTDEGSADARPGKGRAAQVPALVRLAARLAVPLLALCLGMAVLVLVFLALFSLGNGTLGSGRLDGVGVDTAAALRSVGRPTLVGCGLAWLAAVLVVSARYGWFVFRQNRLAATAVPHGGEKGKRNGQKKAGMKAESLAFGPGKAARSHAAPSGAEASDRQTGRAKAGVQSKTGAAGKAKAAKAREKAAARKQPAVKRRAGGQTGSKPRRSVSSSRTAARAGGPTSISQHQPPSSGRTAGPTEGAGNTMEGDRT